ncbi:hypothetical protein [Methylobacterium sp. PvR107]|uniref:hypothetical protein n=1 Tax=Methylobacterium sp. PvR107 TaxID=2806597 RepID=UPI001AE2C44C|nr:hypothetical protein [Methylobacterium sp. PvR107]MBP1180928.1 hypothetical protein [Methylobacterium sp. PvR107]
MAVHLDDSRIDHDTDPDRTSVPITGWPLAALARLDRSGARGLVADLTFAGVLTRQAAFVLLAAVDLDVPGAFLKRLDIQVDGAEGIGLALRLRRARQIIGAAYDLDPDNVPTGFLRALAKVQETRADEPGFQPFNDPATYRRLFDILVGQRNSRRAQALRYCEKLKSSTIDAATTLDPLLLWPEILAVTGTPQRVEAANSMIRLIRDSHTSVDERSLVTAMRQSFKSLGVLEAFAKKALDSADRLPTPIPAAEGVRPLRTAADYREIGTKLRNCAATKIGEVALGLLVVVEVTHRTEDGSEMVFAASLTPISDGRWTVSEVSGAKNRRPSKEALRDVLMRLQALGAIIPGPAIGGPYSKSLANLLGIYRYAALEDALHPQAVDEADELLEAFEAEVAA